VRPRQLIGVLVPLILIGGFALAGRVLGDVAEDGGKSFSLEEISVDAALRRDGVMLVRERVTYDFDGEFSVGTRDFDAGPWEITNIQATEDGRRLRTITNTPTLFEWDIAPASGRHTYELRYQVRNAVIAWPDVVELNWQWVGNNVPTPVDHHAVELRVPGDGEGVRAWAHGPLSGTIAVDGRVITTDVDDLPAYTFLETRVVVPRNRFRDDLPPGLVGQTEPGDYDSTCDVLRASLEEEQARNPALTEAQIEQTLADSGFCTNQPPVETEPQLPRIIEEETVLAEQANEDRARFEAEQQAEEDRRRNFNLAAPLVIAAALLIAYLTWRRWGREPNLETEVDYWREVPDDPPAVAIALMEWGAVDTEAFSATVVDLAQRGYLEIAEEGKDHAFRRTEKAPDDLLEFERKVLDRLFEDGPATSQKQLTSWAKSHRVEAAEWLERFKSRVLASYNARDYQVSGQVAGWLIYILLILALGAFAFFAIRDEAFVAGGAAIGAGVLLLGCMVLLRRRTPKGAQRHAEWAGLRRYLKDFSQLEDAPSGHLILYERYLVAAVALGVADELIEALEVKMPEVANDPTFARWYVGSQAFHYRGLGDFGSGFASATASSFRPPASSSSSGGGFGGGFSGGGGGGGGGGGFGAR
jgi:uncharacterized membrane protein